jgi:3-deoxy-D-manno-octulosonate 8-phosphate phosphatase KdsC-like HAD superfamily phosphatase
VTAPRARPGHRPCASRAATTSCRLSTQLLQQTSWAAGGGFIGDDVIDLPILTRVGLRGLRANGHAK